MNVGTMLLDWNMDMERTHVDHLNTGQFGSSLYSKVLSDHNEFVILFLQGEPITFDDAVFVASRPLALQPFLQVTDHSLKDTVPYFPHILLKAFFGFQSRFSGTKINIALTLVSRGRW